MREAPAIPLRDRASLVVTAQLGREQFAKAVEQLAQAEFDHEDLAVLVSRFPGDPRANTLRQDSLVDSLVRDAIGTWKALSRGH